MIYDLHTHTVFSDGVLIPAESARRAKTAGYSGIAVTDHADFSNYRECIEGALAFKESYNKEDDIFKVLAGAELTHVRPSQIAKLTQLCRSLGADVVLVHGETIMEPVEPGTNRAAIEAGVDVLAHPGLISAEDAALAAEKGVCLEITTRRGHSLTNGHVAAMAKLTGAMLVINNDFHMPGDYVGEAQAVRILKGAGLSDDEASIVIQNTADMFNKFIKG